MRVVFGDRTDAAINRWFEIGFALFFVAILVLFVLGVALDPFVR